MRDNALAAVAVVVLVELGIIRTNPAPPHGEAVLSTVLPDGRGGILVFVTGVVIGSSVIGRSSARAN
jgi:hypothetical protein